MADYDWSCFNARIDVKADPDAIYAAWTTQVDLERWFLRVAEFTSPDGMVRATDAPFQRGDRYRWLWHGYDDTVIERGVIEGGIDLRNKSEKLQKLVNA